MIVLAACSGGGGGSPGSAAALGSGSITAVVHAAAATATAPTAIAAAAAASAAGTNVDLSADANVEAMAVPGTPVGNGGLDGLGDAYASSLLGATTTGAGAQFTLGKPGTLDAVSDVTLKLPAGRFASLNLLATAVNGNQPGQSFVVTYTDGTSKTFTQSLSDWYLAQHFTGESTVATEAYRLYANGTADDRSFNVYGYRFPLDPSKTVLSLRLPASRDVIVLAVNLEAAVTPVIFGAAGNVEAIGNDGQASLDGGLDGSGFVYSSTLLGPAASWSGASFSLGAAGTRGALSSTTVSLPSGAYSALYLLATGVNGGQLHQSFIVTYTDGTSTTLTQSLSDWYAPQSYSGESIVLTETYRNTPQGAKDVAPFHVYGYQFALNAGKTVKSVALPRNRNVVVLAMDLVPAGAATGASSGTGSGGTGTNPPPPLTISGSPTTSLIAGTAFEFTPKVTAASGAVLTYSVQHAPAWAAFDAADGSLSGTPAAGDVGTFTGIVIGVSDGQTSVQLAPFALTVTQSASGSATISWSAPTLNTNGTALTDLAGYRLYYGQTAASMSQMISITNVGTLSYVVTNLSPGTWYFDVEAYSSSGASSLPSAVGTATVN